MRTPLGKTEVTYPDLWQGEALNMPESNVPQIASNANHTHGRKGNAVGMGIKSRASTFPWRRWGLPSQEKAGCLLTGGGVSECKSPSVLRTRVTAAQRWVGPSAKPLLQERASHSTWERCSPGAAFTVLRQVTTPAD